MKGARGQKWNAVGLSPNLRLLKVRVKPVGVQEHLCYHSLDIESRILFFTDFILEVLL